MTLSVSDFSAFHAAVHDGKRPFAWQQRLLEQIVAERAWPRILDLPTGAGKTTCLDIAVFALALDAAAAPEARWCPRRIAMVVDRRIVVDQVAERGRKLANILAFSEHGVVGEVAARLRSLSEAERDPLGVFTLRGGMPKDDGWARTPDQPLIIASTVDQVGSRMLMQGYGVSRGMLPIHAGLLANDTLLLLDEVHLSEPFRQTLDQLARLRTRLASSSLNSRFSHVFLSATPGNSATPPFALRDEDKSGDGPLVTRLHAEKPARLVKVADRDALEDHCVREVKELLTRHRTLAVIVNRVASASAIAEALISALGDSVAVTLLTGRMRPLDRDDVLRNLRPAVETGRARGEHDPKRVVVGTQCLEAGADFDFDALVTEAASLDSLRQRFGRVDRLGRYGRSEGVIVFDKSTKADPIYGKAIVETVKWFEGESKARAQELKEELRARKSDAKKLRGEAKLKEEAAIKLREQVDFGVLAVNVPTDDAPLLAPKQHAPTLLPAYLDLWAQTSPPAAMAPEVGLWLHGPNSGPADVQVVWRADLTDEVLASGNAEVAGAIVAAVRPSSLEAMSLPFATARAWLAQVSVQDLGDTEGAAVDEDAAASSTRGGQERGSQRNGRPALRWNGGESTLIDAAKLRPGHTIVVPATYGGIRWGCFEPRATEVVHDRAEQAALLGRASPVLRLHPAIIAQLRLSLSPDDPAEARVVLGKLAATAGWQGVWAERLAKGSGAFVVEGTERWSVLEGRRVPLADLRKRLQQTDSFEDGVELTTEEEESSFAGRAVALSEHSGDVERFARAYARRLGFGASLSEHIALAAWLHDIGKADSRFQLLLRGGSEIDLLKDATPWAKSATPPGARKAQQLARNKSGYPQGTRHEVQSLAMLAGREEVLKRCLADAGVTAPAHLDLVLHLVASHHGHCRPFAPAMVDAAPMEVTLKEHRSERFGQLDFAATSSRNELGRLDSPVADRFWGLVAEFGWQELCWLEAVLRLADHRASEAEQMKEVAG